MEPFLERVDESELRRKTAREAFHDVRRYIAWGLFWSALLLYSAKLLDLLKEARIENWAWNIIIASRYILEHLGIGFIVSTVAVFFYEWGSHSRRVTELADGLLQELSIQRRIGKKQRYLRAILKADKRAIDNVNGMVAALVRLDNSRHQEVILTLLSRMRKNAEALANLDYVSNTRFLVPPTAATIVDGILSAQMNSLGKGDTYQVVSDLASWQEGWLPQFREATRDAVINRGVNVQRVFNILNEDRHALSATAAAAILRQHLDEVESWNSESITNGFYGLRIFGDAELRGARSSERSDIQGKHFGIFSHSTVDKVSFEIHAHDLSDISISKDEDVVSGDRRAFETIWKNSRAFLPDPGHDSDKVKEAFVLSVVDSFFREDGEAILLTLKKSLDSNLLSVLDEYFYVRETEIRKMIEDKEVLLSGTHEYRLFFKKLFTAFPGATFYATSLPSSTYFWRDRVNENERESVEVGTKDFTSLGGRVERVFFMSRNDEMTEEELNIIRTHHGLGVKVFCIARTLVPPDEHKLFIVESEGRVAAEAFLQDGAIGQLRLTFDKHAAAHYLHIFNLLKGSKDLREFDPASHNATQP